MTMMMVGVFNYALRMRCYVAILKVHIVFIFVETEELAYVLSWNRRVKDLVKVDGWVNSSSKTITLTT